MPTATDFDDQFVGLVNVALLRDSVLCNVNQMKNIGIFKDFKMSTNIA